MSLSSSPPPPVTAADCSCSRSSSSSSATTVVQLAAEKIHLDSEVTAQILERLDLEAIHEEWQLHYLDSFQYESLGFPMGLVASIRRDLMIFPNTPYSNNDSSCNSMPNLNYSNNSNSLINHPPRSPMQNHKYNQVIVSSKLQPPLYRNDTADSPQVPLCHSTPKLLGHNHHHDRPNCDTSLPVPPHKVTSSAPVMPNRRVSTLTDIDWDELVEEEDDGLSLPQEELALHPLDSSFKYLHSSSMMPLSRPERLQSLTTMATATVDTSVVGSDAAPAE